jgi:hypothetical protein
VLVELEQHLTGLHTLSLLVDPSAVLPYLSVGARQRCNVTHLDHACQKICEKCALATNIRLDQCVGGSTVEELLIRVQNVPSC